MKIEDFIPEKRTPHPEYPSCKCMDEKELHKFLAENGVPRSREQDAMNATYLARRRCDSHNAADAIVSAFLGLCEIYNFCRPARRHAAARVLLALSAKLNDIDDPDPLNLDDRNQLDARLFTTRATFDDLVDLASSLLDSDGDKLRGKLSSKKE